MDIGVNFEGDVCIKMNWSGRNHMTTLFLTGLFFRRALAKNENRKTVRKTDRKINRKTDRKKEK